MIKHLYNTISNLISAINVRFINFALVTSPLSIHNHMLMDQANSAVENRRQ